MVSVNNAMNDTASNGEFDSLHMCTVCRFRASSKDEFQSHCCTHDAPPGRPSSGDENRPTEPQQEHSNLFTRGVSQTKMTAVVPRTPRSSETVPNEMNYDVLDPLRTSLDPGNSDSSASSVTGGSMKKPLPPLVRMRNTPSTTENEGSEKRCDVASGNDIPGVNGDAAHDEPVEIKEEYIEDDEEEGTAAAVPVQQELVIASTSGTLQPQTIGSTVPAEANTLKKVYVCPKCSVWVNTVSRFHAHMQEHLGEKPFSCSKCPYRSRWRWDVATHIAKQKEVGGASKLLHMDAEPLMASIDDSYYNQHLRVVTNEMIVEASRARASLRKEKTIKTRIVVRGDNNGYGGSTDGIGGPDPLAIEEDPLSTGSSSSHSQLNQLGPTRVPPTNTLTIVRDTSVGIRGNLHVRPNVTALPGTARYVISSSPMAAAVAGTSGGVTSDGATSSRPLASSSNAVIRVNGAESSSAWGSMKSDVRQTVQLNGIRGSLAPMEKPRLFKCKKCDYRHPDKNVVLEHIRSHYAERYGEMANVLTKSTPSEGKVPYECGHCHQIFYGKHEIIRHCRLMHKGQIALRDSRTGGDMEQLVIKKKDASTSDIRVPAESPKAVETLVIQKKEAPKNPLSSPIADRFPAVEISKRGSVRTSDGSARKCNHCPFVTYSDEDLQRHLPFHGNFVPGCTKCKFCSFASVDVCDVAAHLPLHTSEKPSESITPSKKTTKARKESVSSGRSSVKVENGVGAAPVKSRPAKPTTGITSRVYFTKSRYQTRLLVVDGLRYGFHRIRKTFQDSVWRCQKRPCRSYITVSHDEDDSDEAQGNVVNDRIIIVAGPTSHSNRRCLEFLFGRKQQEEELLPKHDEEEEEEEEERPLEPLISSLSFHEGFGHTSGEKQQGRRKTYSCDVCPYSGCNKSQFEHHIKFHVSDPLMPRPFQCSVCSYSVSKLHLLFQHERLHNIFRPPKPKKPSKLEFLEDTECKSVKREREDPLADSPPVKRAKVEQLRCPHCPYVCNFQKSMDAHLKFHDEDKECAFNCELCSFRCDEECVLTMHSLLHVEKVENHVFKEPKTVTPRRRQPQVKMSTRRFGTKRPGAKKNLFFCPSCPAIFERIRELRPHWALHSELAQGYRCEECSYAARNSGLLRKHQTYHSEKQAKKVRRMMAMHAVSAKFPLLDFHQEFLDQFPADEDETKELEKLAESRRLRKAAEKKVVDRPVVETNSEAFDEAEDDVMGENEEEVQEEDEETTGEVDPLEDDSDVAMKDSVEDEVDPELDPLGDVPSMCNSPAPPLASSSPSPPSQPPGELPPRRINRPVRFQGASDEGAGPSSFSCPRCPARFEERSKLEAHFVFHGANLKYCCFYCDYAHRTPVVLDMHLKCHRKTFLQDMFAVQSDNSSGSDDESNPSSSSHQTKDDVKKKKRSPRLHEQNNGKSLSVEAVQKFFRLGKGGILPSNAAELQRGFILGLNRARADGLAKRLSGNVRKYRTPSNVAAVMEACSPDGVTKTMYYCTNCPYGSAKKDVLMIHAAKHKPERFTFGRVKKVAQKSPAEESEEKEASEESSEEAQSDDEDVQMKSGSEEEEEESEDCKDAELADFVNENLEKSEEEEEDDEDDRESSASASGTAADTTPEDHEEDQDEESESVHENVEESNEDAEPEDDPESNASGSEAPDEVAEVDDSDTGFVEASFEESEEGGRENYALVPHAPGDQEQHPNGHHEAEDAERSHASARGDANEDDGEQKNDEADENLERGVDEEDPDDTDNEEQEVEADESMEESEDKEEQDYDSGSRASASEAAETSNEDCTSRSSDPTDAKEVDQGDEAETTDEHLNKSKEVETEDDWKSCASDLEAAEDSAEDLEKEEQNNEGSCSDRSEAVESGQEEADSVDAEEYDKAVPLEGSKDGEPKWSSPIGAGRDEEMQDVEEAGEKVCASVDKRRCTLDEFKYLLSAANGGELEGDSASVAAKDESDDNQVKVKQEMSPEAGKQKHESIKDLEEEKFEGSNGVGPSLQPAKDLCPPEKAEEEMKKEHHEEQQSSHQKELKDEASKEEDASGGCKSLSAEDDSTVDEECKDEEPLTFIVIDEAQCSSEEDEVSAPVAEEENDYAVEKEDSSFGLEPQQPRKRTAEEIYAALEAEINQIEAYFKNEKSSGGGSGSVPAEEMKPSENIVSQAEEGVMQPSDIVVSQVEDEVLQLSDSIVSHAEDEVMQPSDTIMSMAEDEAGQLTEEDAERNEKSLDTSSETCEKIAQFIKDQLLQEAVGHSSKEVGEEDEDVFLESSEGSSEMIIQLVQEESVEEVMDHVSMEVGGEAEQAVQLEEASRQSFELIAHLVEEQLVEEVVGEASDGETESLAVAELCRELKYCSDTDSEDMDWLKEDEEKKKVGEAKDEDDSERSSSSRSQGSSGDEADEELECTMDESRESSVDEERRGSLNRSLESNKTEDRGESQKSNGEDDSMDHSHGGHESGEPKEEFHGEQGGSHHVSREEDSDEEEKHKASKNEENSSEVEDEDMEEQEEEQSESHVEDEPLENSNEDVEEEDSNLHQQENGTEPHGEEVRCKYCDFVTSQPQYLASHVKSHFMERQNHTNLFADLSGLRRKVVFLSHPRHRRAARRTAQAHLSDLD